MKLKIKPIHLTQEDILLIERTIRREKYILDGGCDGRNANRITIDRKKEHSKKKCRKKVYID